MAIQVNAVLTACYHAVFGESSGRTEQDELMLVTAPLSAASEVQGLYEKGVIDYESALPAALAAARAEAQSAFGSGELILERALVDARHV